MTKILNQPLHPRLHHYHQHTTELTPRQPTPIAADNNDSQHQWQLCCLYQDLPRSGLSHAQPIYNNEEVCACIKKATSQVGGLRAFFRYPYINLEMKTKLYTAIPLNTILWGCESWAHPDKRTQMGTMCLPLLQPTKNPKHQHGCAKLSNNESQMCICDSKQTYLA